MKYLLIFILGFIFICVSITGITVITQKIIDSSASPEIVFPSSNKIVDNIKN